MIVSICILLWPLSSQAPREVRCTLGDQAQLHRAQVTCNAVAKDPTASCEALHDSLGQVWTFIHRSL